MSNDKIITLLTIICAVIDVALITIGILYERKKRKESARKFAISKYTYKLVLSAVFIGVALVLKRFSLSIPLFGAENGMRVGLTGVFSAFPAILCGPLFGGIASAILDVLGYFMNPTGPYTLIFTLTAFMAGAIRGFIWIFIKKMKKSTLAVICSALLLAVGVVGIVNTVNLNRDGLMNGIIATTQEAPEKEDLYYYNEYIKTDGTTAKKMVGEKETFNGKELSFSGKMLRDMNKTKGLTSFRKSMATYANLITIVLICASIVGMAFIGISLLLTNRIKMKNDSFLNILVSILGAELIETSINTQAILSLYGISLSYILYWIPRVTESVLVCIVQGYLISVLYGIYLTLPKSIKNKIEG